MKPQSDKGIGPKNTKPSTEIVNEIISILKEQEKVSQVELTNVMKCKEKKPKEGYGEFVITAYSNNDYELMSMENKPNGKVSEIQLDSKNMVMGKIGKEQFIKLVIDSGASKSLISSEIVEESPILSKLEQSPIQEMRLYVGNGDTLLAKTIMYVPVKIEEFEFRIPFYVAKPMTREVTIIGTDFLSKIHAVIDITRRKLQFDSHQIQPILHAQHKVETKPKINTKTVMTQTVDQNNETDCNTKKERVHSNNEYELPDIECDGMYELTIGNEALKDSENNEIDLTKLTETEKNNYVERKRKYPWLNNDRLYKETNKIIEEDIKFQNTILDENSQEIMKDLVKQHSNAFAIFGEVGEFKTMKAEIALKEHENFAIKPYPINQKYKKLVNNEVERLTQLGILEEGDVVDISPAFPVVKSDGKSIRLVVDNRLLNQYTKKDAYPMLNYDLLLKYIGDQSPVYLSTLDISTAYYSLKTTEETKKHLGIAIGDKILRLTAIPQGGVNSSSTFTRAMDKILSRHYGHNECVFSYIDDLFVVTRTFEEHQKAIKRLLEILEEEGVKLSLEKTIFAAKELSILGHIFTCTENGIEISVKKKRIDAITKLDVPKNVKQLRSFLGATNFLAKHLPDYRRKAAILYQMTGKKSKFEFTAEHIKAFEDVKNLVKSAEVIHLPKPNAKKRLITDSSEVGYGAVLYDVIIDEAGNEQKFVIAYDSKSYGKKKFGSSMHHEMFAFVSATLTLKYFLYGHDFELITDSLSMAKLSEGRKSLAGNGPLIRLFEKLNGFSFTIIHAKANESRDIQIADALSRLRIKPEMIENPDLIYPIAYPSKYCDKMLSESELVLTNMNQKTSEQCLYNLRKDRKITDRYGQTTECDSENDCESENEESEIKTTKNDEIEEQVDTINKLTENA